MRDIFSPGTPIIHIGEIPIQVKIVDTPDSRKQGLSGQEELPGVDGMLFVFDTSDYHEIWMKGMKFPIDIIWIDESLIVINVEEAVSPDTYPRKFRPTRPARYAVETNAQYADTFGITAGKKVRLPLSVEDTASSK